jgi:phage tail sheath protein FI
MPVNPTYPGLYIEELPSSARTITPAPTSITVFVGYTHPFRGLCAEQNRWEQAIQIFSFSDYERMFGGLYRHEDVPSDVADAVYQFFLNGGSNAYVVPLKPRWNPNAGPAAIAPATTNINGITFTSKELTDDDHKLSITIRNINPTSLGVADIVITFATTVEHYRNVSLSSASPDFIDKKLAGSTLVSVKPQVGVNYPATYGVPAPTASSVLTATLGDMGSLGPVYAAADFTKVFRNDEPLDKVEIFNLLVIPGVTDNTVWQPALAYCERKLAFFIMDPPKNASADDTAGNQFTKIQDYVDQDMIPHTSANGAFYFPYLKAPDPLTGTIREQPPSGYVAGVYARTDVRRGVWKAPAGLEAGVLGTTGVVDSGRMTDMRQGTINAKGVNVLRSFPGSGTVIWGARTLGISSAFEPWRYVPVRRMALFIEQSLMRNLGWVVFEPNDEPLWTAIRISIDNFMLSLFKQQAFQGKTPSEAFRVTCDKTTTTQEDINLGKVNIVVAFRPLKPAEFVIIKIAQLAGQAP